MMIATDTDVLAIVTEIVREEIGASPDQRLPPTAHLRNDLGFDSILEAETAMEIEDRFELDVPDDSLPPTIQEVADRVAALLKARGAGE